MIDFDTIEQFVESTLNQKDEVFVHLENIQTLEPIVNTEQEFSIDVKVETEEKKFAKKKQPRKRENVSREICRLREEVAIQKKKNEILRNKLILRKEKNKKLELLFKKITSPN